MRLRSSAPAVRVVDVWRNTLTALAHHSSPFRLLLAQRFCSSLAFFAPDAQIDSVGEQTLFVREPPSPGVAADFTPSESSATASRRIVSVQVRAVGAALFVAIKPELPEFPPYAVRNNTDAVCEVTASRSGSALTT